VQYLVDTRRPDEGELVAGEFPVPLSMSADALIRSRLVRSSDVPDAEWENWPPS
jgi:hypothetical protein